MRSGSGLARKALAVGALMAVCSGCSRSRRCTCNAVTVGVLIAVGFLVLEGIFLVVGVLVIVGMLMTVGVLESKTLGHS